MVHRGPVLALFLASLAAAQQPPPAEPLAPAPASTPETAGDPELLPEPRLRIALDYGIGDEEHKTNGSALDGKTDAMWVRIAIEAFGDANWGGGARLGAAWTDDDLFADAGANPTDSKLGEVYLHGTYRAGGDDLVMPVRLGVYFDNQELEDNTLDARTTFATVAALLEVEPEMRLLRWPTSKVSLYGTAAIGYGWTQTSTDPDTNTWESWSILFGLGIGVRARLQSVELSVAYRWWQEHMDRTNTEGGTAVLGFDDTISGIEFGLGFVF